MGYAISGKFFEAAKVALEREGSAARLVGVYPYEDGTIHVITSEDDSTPRLVLAPYVNGTYYLSLSLTAEYAAKRQAHEEAEVKRRTAIATREKAEADARTIVVEKRSEDWSAHVKGDKTLWDRGNTVEEAIGALIRTHGDKLGLRLERGET